jgi:hypothetical protein
VPLIDLPNLLLLGRLLSPFTEKSPEEKDLRCTGA